MHASFKWTALTPRNLNKHGLFFNEDDGEGGKRRARFT